MTDLIERVKRIRGADRVLGLRFCSRTAYADCLPEGARLFAETDNALLCFIEGYQQTVFAVELPSAFVRPLAYDFTEFLRLVFACGSADRAAAPLEEVPVKPLDFSGTGLKKLQIHLGLTPITKPAAYLYTIGQVLDCRRIRA